jgi:amidase
MSGFPEYANYDALGLAELVRKKEVTPTELIEEAINRIEQHNPKLNAVIHKMYDHARKAASNPLPDGAFTGVPFLLKDLMSAYAGAPMTGASHSLKNYIPAHDSEMVKRFKAAGVIPVGKTNLPEFGIPPYTEPELFGATHNPWDLSRTPGGSSGGSAAAVAARLVPMASGGDGGGSIRIPASCCGLFGMKPTRGRNPWGPDIGDSMMGFNVEHVLTRSVRDSAAMMDATSGADIGAPYYAPTHTTSYLQEVTTEPRKLRIAYTSHPFLGNHVDAECVAGLNTTIKLLRDLGHEVVEDAPYIDREETAIAFLTIFIGEAGVSFYDLKRMLGREIQREEFEAETYAMALVGNSISAAQYLSALHYLHGVARQIGHFFEGYDMLLTPTLADPPVPTGSLQPKPIEKTLLRAIGMLRAGWLLAALNITKTLANSSFNFTPYTPLFNVTGQPAMSVPLHWTASGLPVGMQFVGRYADEGTLFQLAGQLERACSWFDRAPNGF